MSILPGMAIYGTGRLDDKTFADNFIARQDILAIIIADLTRAANGGTVHHLLIAGVRGMGKSTLLRRVAIAIDEDTDLSGKLLPLRFREEQYNVNSLDSFWRNCGEALADWAEAHHQQELADGLDKAITTEAWRNADLAASAFLNACDRAGGRAVLLVDNLDLILEGLSDDEQWQLRGVLQGKDGPIMVGAATRLLDQTSKRDQPFYEFFHPHFLEPLSEADLFHCIRNLAERRGEPGKVVLGIANREPQRLKTLYTLTGGNPRILALIYQLLERADTGEVVADLEALLDQVTPYYKARVEDYATPQQRAIIDAIALHWDPILSRGIADATGIEITTVSSHLHKLRKEGFVEEVETSGARSGYQIAERFLNIWYLMRHGTRRTKQRLKWLAIFLSRLFSPEELAVLAGQVRSGDTTAAFHPAYAAAVLEAEAMVSEFKFLDRNRAAGEELQRVRPGSPLLQEARAMWDEAMAADRSGDHIREIAVYDTVIDRFGQSNDPILRELLGAAMANKGAAFDQLNRPDEAFAAFDAMIDHFDQPDNPALLEQVARTMVNRGALLSKLKKSDEALAAYDALIDRFGQTDDPTLRQQVATAMLNKAIVLGQFNRPDDQLAAYDAVIDRFGQTDDPTLRQQVGMAMVNKGEPLGQLNRLDDELAAYNAVIDRFGQTNDPTLRKQVAMAMLNKGKPLDQLNKPNEVLAACEAFIDRFGQSDDPSLRKLVAMAMVNKGRPLGQLNRPDDQLAAYDAVIDRFGQTDDPTLRQQVAMAIVNKVRPLGQLNRADEALSACDALIDRFGQSDDPTLREHVVMAMVKKGNILLDDYHDTAAAKSIYLRADVLAGGSLVANANLAWINLTDDKSQNANAFIEKVRELPLAGRHLLNAAREIVTNNLGLSLASIHTALGHDLESDGWSFTDDLLRYLRLAESHGHGEAVIAWFESSGMHDRYAPIYAAFIAFIRGERFLKDVNPEVRAPAKVIYNKLSAPRRHQQKLAPPSPKSTRGRKPKRRG